MKFGVQFEFHKIPEWYSEYLDYRRFKGIIKKFKKKVKSKSFKLLLLYFCIHQTSIYFGKLGKDL